MKSMRKPTVGKSSKYDINTAQHKTVIRLHVVSAKERDLYRVPSYEYLIP